MGEPYESGFWRRSAEYLGFVQPRVSGVSETRDESAATVPPSRPTITTVTPDTALGIGAVYRAVSIIVTSVSQMELGVFRAGREISTPALVRTPNVNDTAAAFVEETVFSLAAWGNAYWRLYRADASSPVQSIKVLDPADVSFTEDVDTGKVTYYVQGLQVRNHQIKHLKLMRKPGRAAGVGPIQAAAGELTAALKLRAFADSWFDTAGIPTGYLTTDLVLGPEESAEFAKAWKRFLAEHDGVGVLSQGLNYQHLNIKPAEAQFLEVQQASVVAIARLFGVPAMHMLAELTGTSNTYLNLEQAAIVFMQTTLARYMNEFENALSDLLPRGQRVQFKEEGLLRLDSSTLWKVRETQTRIGYTSGAELRAKDGLEPLALPEPVEGDAA